MGGTDRCRGFEGLLFGECLSILVFVVVFFRSVIRLILSNVFGSGRFVFWWFVLSSKRR